MRPHIVALALAACALAACGGDTTGPGSSACATLDGIGICADRSEYRPGATVTLTISNGGAATVFVDDCSVEIVGKTSRDAAFETDYDPRLRCGPDVTLADIVSRMIELPPGASIAASHGLATFAFQGFYRVNVWVLDETGARTTTTPFHSGTFEVFPTAR